MPALSDAQLLAAIRSDLARSPFQGDGLMVGEGPRDDVRALACRSGSQPQRVALIVDRARPRFSACRRLILVGSSAPLASASPGDFPRTSGSCRPLEFGFPTVFPFRSALLRIT